MARERDEQGTRGQRPGAPEGMTGENRDKQRELREEQQQQQDAAGPAARGFFIRATERRVYLRPRGTPGYAEPSHDEGARFRSAERSRGRGGASEPDEYGRGPGGYGGRSSRGYGRDATRSSRGGYYGQGSGEFDRERGYGDSRDAYAGERKNRQARRRDAGPYTEGRSPHHEGLPSDLRAGEGQWAQPGGYAELDRGTGYEPGYEAGEWSPGGDASVPLRMGYGDYGVRGGASHGESGHRRRWTREPVLARDIMTSNPSAVRPQAALREIARIMRDENTGIVPVCEADGRLLGVVTDRDIVMRTLADDESPLQATARDVMTDDVEAVTPDEELRDVVHLMGERQVRRIPVVERGDRLVGIISMADVATRADYDEDLQDALEEISARRSFWSRLFR